MDSLDEMEKIARAYSFADRAHGDQKRKYTGEPYINHPVRVAQILLTVNQNTDAICAAFLHDVVEDTPITLDEIGAEFGENVRNLVYYLTDISKPSDGNREKRKEIDRLHNANGPPDAQDIKMADMIENGIDISNNDKDFAVVYMKEKELTVEALTKAHPALRVRALQIIEEHKASRKK